MLNSLQRSRGIAALLVCAFHASGTLAESQFGGDSTFRRFTSFGYLGVDFFFALSGFIILMIHAREIGQPKKISSYAIKRFIRIYPLYWVVTFLVLLGATVTAGSNSMPTHPLDVASTLSLIHLNNYEAPVHPAWTLYHEILFYAIFSVLLWKRTAGLTILAGWFVAIITSNIIFKIDVSNAFASTVLAPVNFGFFGGMCAYLIFRHAGKFTLTCFLAGGLLALVLSLQFGDPGSPYFKAALACSFMGIIGGLAGLEENGIDFKIPTLFFLGNASFSLYLTHENVQSFFLKQIYKHHLENAVPLWVLYVDSIAASIVFALFFFACVEKPMLKWMRRWIEDARGRRRQTI